jgi:hypothetical protein
LIPVKGIIISFIEYKKYTFHRRLVNRQTGESGQSLSGPATVTGNTQQLPEARIPVCGFQPEVLRGKGDGG